MGRIEKTVFISYRRDHGGVWARAIYQDLVANGYDAFFDFQSIDSGDFSRIIIENIKARAHFLVLLAPSALERCEDPNDWLRREIETAIDCKRNIVPILLESFDFGNPDAVKVLTGKLATLKKYNGLRIYADYFEEGMARLRNRYLNIALDAVLHPVSEEVQKATKEQQFAANNAQPVKQKELTANEWFERGIRVTDPDEKIRYYSEAIRLKPDYSLAYNNRGSAYQTKGNFEASIEDYTRSIELGNPLLHLPYSSRSISREALGDLTGALEDAREAVRLKPDHALALLSLYVLLRKLGKDQEASQYELLVRAMIYTDIEYNQACFEAFCGNTEKALKLLKIGLEKGQSSKEWARQDPDLENIRNNPRFKELVGE